MGPEDIRPCRRGRGLLENKLQAELNRARASRTHGRVGGGDVGSGAAATEATHGRIIEAETILATVGVVEVGMVENVEELRPELRVEALAKMPVFGHGEIEVAETGIGENVTSHGAEGSQCWWNHDGVPLGVAAEQAEGSLGRTHACSSIQVLSILKAGRGHGRRSSHGVMRNLVRARLEVVGVSK